MQIYILRRYIKLFWKDATLSDVLLTELKQYSWVFVAKIKENAWLRARDISRMIETSTNAHLNIVTKRTTLFIEFLEYLDHKGLLIGYHLTKDSSRKVVPMIRFNPVNESYFNGKEL